ncbi:MAG: hypothetical protein ACP5M9_01640 [Candidatus Micrarchaeia archaeon]
MAIFSYIKDKRILALILILVILGVADFVSGIHLGVEFIGGTEIPITLQSQVNPTVMSSILANLQQRISTFGLKQVTIEGVGDSEVYVIIPSVSSTDINSTISVIEKQGIFQGIVNGREALNGSDVLGGSTGGIQPSQSISGSNATWQVNFYVTQTGAQKFAKVAFGQADKPIYMYLDRPTNTIILLNTSIIAASEANVSTGLTPNQNQVIKAMNNALQFGSQTTPVEILSQNNGNWNTLYQFFNESKSRYNEVILGNSTPSYIIQNLTKLNYTLVYKSAQSLTPQLIQEATNSTSVTSLVVNTWPAVGLLSAPVLSPGITSGQINEAYQITGAVTTGATVQDKLNQAVNESTTIASVLSGGALPVKVIVGTPFTTPPTLGTQFESISFIAILLAVLAVTVTIVIRYRKPFLVLPIIFTTLAELFIIASIIGLIGTIDLAAVAGMIAVVGTGVDAQIIITDETLTTHGSGSSIKSKLNHAFYVVWADAILLVIGMMPLLFSSSLVTVIGFAESTILGALLGALITRPAYGAIISRHFSHNEEKAKI